VYNTLIAAKGWVGLRFEQRRFYNPHHHPEMPRTLQPSGRRVRHGEDTTEQYDLSVLRLISK
jgi:hypothetical protein